jgi:hypothetical protein
MKKPRERQRQYREHLRTQGWETITFILPSDFVATVRRVAKRERFTLGEAVVMLATQRMNYYP